MKLDPRSARPRPAANDRRWYGVVSRWIDLRCPQGLQSAPISGIRRYRQRIVDQPDGPALDVLMLAYPEMRPGSLQQTSVSSVHTSVVEGGRGMAGVDSVRRAVVALNQGNVDAYQEAFAPSCLRWSSGSSVAAPAGDVADTLRALHAAFRDLRLDKELLLESGRYVIARWVITGLHEAAFGGIAASGRSIEVRTCEIYEFDGDLVVNTWSYGDPLEMPRQLGVA